MRGTCGITLGIVAVLLAGMQTAGAADDVVTVTATGNGTDHDTALKDALRNALEQGAGVDIFNKSKTENFELVRDTILTRAEGLVRKYDILKEGDAAGDLYFCDIRAEVSRDPVAREWGEVQNLLLQLGNPKITVFIAETIDGQPSTSSILESKIEKRLLEVGFQVYSRTQLDAIKAKEVDDAIRRGDQGKVQAWAKRFATQIFITGHANANQAELKMLHGSPFAFYNCDVQAKTYYTDTGKLLDSSSKAVTRGGARGENRFSPQAGKMAFEQAAPHLIDEMYEMVMKNWAYEISFGGHIDLEVSGVPDAGESLDLEDQLAEIEGVEAVNSEYGQDGLTFYRIRAKITGKDLGKRIRKGALKSKLKILDYSLNRVQAKWIGK